MLEFLITTSLGTQSVALRTEASLVPWVQGVLWFTPPGSANGVSTLLFKPSPKGGGTFMGTNLYAYDLLLPFPPWDPAP